MKRIVVATDFSPASDAALDRAIALAGLSNAALEIVHVRQPFLGALLQGLPVIAEPTSEAVAELDDKLTGLAERAAAADLVCLTYCLEGSPAVALVEHARKAGADLIVMGRHAHHDLVEAILGTVARRVAETAFCAVLIVPP